MDTAGIAKIIEDIEKIRQAQKKFSTYTQEQVDEIFQQVAMTAITARVPLAKLAVEETGIGLVEDKIIKNHFAAEYIYDQYKDEKTCGVIETDEAFGFTRIAEPVGVITAVVPITSPTATVIFKALLSLKTRNGIIFCPHPSSKKSSIAAAKIILEAAVKAGAPEGIVGWVENPTVELSQVTMSKADLILATGGAPMVKAAYSSGKPAIGVGAGNTPVVIDETADLRMAVNSIVLSKTFDLGLSCSSEQSVIVLSKVYAAVKKEFEERGAYFLKGDELDKVRKTIFTDHVLNNDIVGQPAIKIAALSDITVPVATKVLIGEVESVELDEPFSREKLSPLLAMYQAKNFEEAMQKAGRLLELSGRGHTSVLYTDPSLSADRIEKFNTTIKTCRILINTPSSQGASGGFFNSKLVPSLMLGCGSWGGNSVCGNIGVKHLLNIKSIASRRENMMWFRVPPKIYFKYGCLPVALRDLKKSGKKKAFIVTDKVLYELGFADNVLRVLEELHIDYKVIFDVEPEPSYTTVRRGAEEVTGFQPDAIIALGGGSVIDAAKMMRALYEHPQIQLEKIALPFMEINKKILSLPETGKKAILIAIPTTAGTGSEITAFAAITDEKTGLKNPLADFGFIPDIAIIDAALTMKMPKALTAASGMDALVHALESFVSVFASEYTNGLALEAIRLIFKYLPEAYHGGNTNIEAREKMSYAAAIAGMAFGNTSLGICHSMAHQLGAVHHVTHGVANALLIAEVIRFNGVETPEKQAAFPQYKYQDTKERYARIAAYLNLGGTTDSEKTVLLIAAIEDLKTQVGMPTSIKDAGVSETQFYATLDAMSEHAFEDQCTGTNPRFPLIRELKQLYINSFERQQRVKPELESTLAKESLAER